MMYTTSEQERRDGPALLATNLMRSLAEFASKAGWHLIVNLGPTSEAFCSTPAQSEQAERMADQINMDALEAWLSLAAALDRRQAIGLRIRRDAPMLAEEFVTSAERAAETISGFTVLKPWSAEATRVAIDEVTHLFDVVRAADVATPEGAALGLDTAELPLSPAFAIPAMARTAPSTQVSCDTLPSAEGPQMTRPSLLMADLKEITALEDDPSERRGLSNKTIGAILTVAGIPRAPRGGAGKRHRYPVGEVIRAFRLALGNATDYTTRARLTKALATFPM